MKLFVVFIASVLAGTNAAITRPDQVLADINTAEQDVATYQSDLQSKIRDIRAGGAALSSEYISGTISAIKNNIKLISESDVGVREALAAETASVCITNLENFSDDIIELSGYATSNCIELKEAGGVNQTVDISAALDKFEHEVNALGLIPVNALVGNNVFTEGTAIVAKINEQLAAKKVDFDARLEDLLAQSGGVSNEFKAELAALNSCFVNIQKSVTAGVGVIQSQIPVCVKFASRSSRSSFPFKASDFFPQLHKDE